MNTARLVAIVTALLAYFACAYGQDPGTAPKTDPDDALLEAYRSGEEDVGYGYWAIHKSPKAGQGARYRDLDVKERAYRVAFVRDNVCTVERQESASAIVIAVEFELTGAVENLVRRAWVGRKGEKPFVAKVAPLTRGSGGIGLGGAYETTNEPFVDLEQGGRKWSGNLQTTKFWKRKVEGEPHEITRFWTSTENWFKQSIRNEVETKGEDKRIAEMFECSDSMEPLLNWSDVPAPTPEQDKELRAPLLKAAAEGDLRLMVSGNLSHGKIWGLHPNAKTGDWARYSQRKLVLVKLENGRGVVETSYPDDERGLVEAMEFKVEDGKATAVVARFVGITGGQPTLAVYNQYSDQRPLETVAGEWKEVELAGRKWNAREVHNIRNSLQERNPTNEIIDVLESAEAPFGQPLRRKSFWEDQPDKGSTLELSECGEGAKPLLDWSAWKPTAEWKAPFTAEDAKAFIKLGMRWRYSQVLDKGEEGEVTIYQDWTVIEVNETGYKVECVSTHPDGTKNTLSDTMHWEKYVERIETLNRGSVEESTLKINDREIRTFIYRSNTYGKDVLYALSPDLPGVRVATEEDIYWPSKVWLLEFHEADEDK